MSPRTTPINVRVTVSVKSDAIPKLRRLRYPFLTPIGHRVPMRGTTARDMLEVGVNARRFVRKLRSALGLQPR